MFLHLLVNSLSVYNSQNVFRLKPQTRDKKPLLVLSDWWEGPKYIGAYFGAFPLVMLTRATLGVELVKLALLLDINVVGSSLACYVTT